MELRKIVNEKSQEIYNEHHITRTNLNHPHRYTLSIDSKLVVSFNTLIACLTIVLLSQMTTSYIKLPTAIDILFKLINYA